MFVKGSFVPRNPGLAIWGCDCRALVDALKIACGRPLDMSKRYDLIQLVK